MIKKIIDVVRDAGKLMKNDNVDIIQKGNTSNYVTSIDVNVQKYLEEKLLELLPGSSFVGEEGDTEKATGEYVWVVDPIDGTSNFIRDIGISSISVGLIKSGLPYLGVIYQPFRNEMYWGETGNGAYMNGKRIHVSDRDFAHSH